MKILARIVIAGLVIVAIRFLLLGVGFLAGTASSRTNPDYQPTRSASTQAEYTQAAAIIKGATSDPCPAEQVTDWINASRDIMDEFSKTSPDELYLAPVPIPADNKSTQTPVRAPLYLKLEARQALLDTPQCLSTLQGYVQSFYTDAANSHFAPDAATARLFSQKALQDIENVKAEANRLGYDWDKR